MGLKEVENALGVLDRALSWNPKWVFLLYSGGYDSVCSTHIGWAWAKAHNLEHRTKVISLDTGVAADGWREYVERVARCSNDWGCLMSLTNKQVQQHVHTLRFAGLTPSQQDALNALVKAFEDQRAAAAPFGVMAERYLDYRRQHSDLSRRVVLDFTAWLDKYGEDPDVLFGQFKAVSDGSL